MKATCKKLKNDTYTVNLSGLTEGKLMALAQALAIYSWAGSPVAADVKCSLERAVVPVLPISDSFKYEPPKESE